MPAQWCTGWVVLRKLGARLMRHTGRAERMIRRLLPAKGREIFGEDGDMAVQGTAHMGHCHGKLCSL